MFDRVKIWVKSGKGGNGTVSFRREKFVPLGGPDGGDGGKGGDVILKVNKNEASLKKYYFKREYLAQDGKPGQSRKKHGKSGKTITLTIPPGTVVTDISDPGNSYEIADMNKTGDQLLVAKGGRGGSGNVHFTSSTNQTPKLASKGEEAEERTLLLELKMIADAGIIGLPNAGKSSLLVASSQAKPKVASYPFTTLEPNLGIVERGPSAFIMADIPGLINGAAEGKGLGHEFLRHIVRTKLLVHLVDGSSADPIADFELVNRELELYDRSLVRKKQLVVINKVDLPEAREKLSEIIRIFARKGYSPDFISALTGEGVEGLLNKISRQLAKEPLPEIAETAGSKVFKPEPAKAGLVITQQKDGFEIKDPGLERIIEGSQVGDSEVRRQIWRLVKNKGGFKLLEKAGVKPGDVIRLGSFEWRW